MNKFVRWLMVGFILVLAVMLIKQGLDLWSLGTNVDGDGIGVYFLGQEINDRVPEENIPTYSIGFLISGLLAILLIPAVLRIASKTVNR
ncbi:hypothetical protein FZW96_14075 [Bacillus sp. BGMRC 2118]|nr:hypothetical protein FZW96_14075 [Bacillus sp. BGMRC 2118]